MLPKRSCLAQEENRKTARGTKGMNVKDRASVYMYTNVTGSAKVPISIIGEAKNPRCFGRKSSPTNTSLQATRGQMVLPAASGGWGLSCPSFGVGASSL